MRHLAAGVVALAAAALAACGGGSDNGTGNTADGDVLHLRNSTWSATDYRDYIRKLFVGPVYAQICKGIKGLSTDEALKALMPEGDQSNNKPVAGSTAVPGQTPNPDNARRAVDIVREECDRIASP